jgi:hypothetical protein
MSRRPLSTPKYTNKFVCMGHAAADEIVMI